ncbi:MAG: hypothetical protein Q7S96_04845 [bacterium]|nr:hypothetical protein [bacterium]
MQLEKQLHIEGAHYTLGGRTEYLTISATQSDHWGSQTTSTLVLDLTTSLRFGIPWNAGGLPDTITVLVEPVPYEGFHAFRDSGGHTNELLALERLVWEELVQDRPTLPPHREVRTNRVLHIGTWHASGEPLRLPRYTLALLLTPNEYLACKNQTPGTHYRITLSLVHA